jgi:1-deoxy-D-xylulose-5-phosphate reductoisomerase
VAESARSVALLGATGSIGTQTLDVLRRSPEHFRLVALSGGTRTQELIAIAREFNVALVGVLNDSDAKVVAAALPAVNVVVGDAGLDVLARSADIVVNAVVGFAGLTATLAALDAGKRLALANKESLVAAAPLVDQVRANRSTDLVPIDSEHCAIHQCLAGADGAEGYRSVKRLLLTASGGPFRTKQLSELQHVTKDDALHHPTWAMGPKITVDSSTLMNKGLEVLEAAALFGIGVDRIDVVVHPQSIVHSMVEYVDGSTLAQLSHPDMRLPIAYCLGLPERLNHSWGAISFDEVMTLTFEPPNREAFPALDLAYEAGRRGGAAPAWLSAANEVAVEAFLEDRIAWSDIVPVVARTLDAFDGAPLTTVEELRDHDGNSRRIAAKIVTAL